jgi:peptide/nickel transport system permease protein
MLGELLRRLLWTAPTALAVSLLLFATLARQGLQGDPFAHLPRFLNTQPADVRLRAWRAVDALREGESGSARAELATLGGAALPTVLPALEGLSPLPRSRVVAALRPVAERMGMAQIAALEADPEAAAARWVRFWEDRSMDFRPAAVRRTVRRYAAHPSPSRLRELQLLDTAALREMFDVLGQEGSLPNEAQAATLVPIVRHTLGMADPPEGSQDTRAQVVSLRAIWFARRLEFIGLDGPSRALATVLETQYGKWAGLAVSHNLGPEHGGHPVAEVLLEKGLPTALRVWLGLGGGVALALLLALASALGGKGRGGRSVDRASLALLLLCAAAPPALAAYAARRAGLGGNAVASAAVVLSVALASARLVRRHVRDQLAMPHVTTARAFGASPAGLVRAALGLPALGLLLTVVGAELPLATSAALVAERLCSLDGLGVVTARALGERDVAMLMSLAVLGALLAQFTVGVGALAQAMGDARIRDLAPGDDA